MVCFGSFLLISKFLLFQYSCLNISLKTRNSQPTVLRISKGVTECLLCASVKVTPLSDGEKIITEYLNNRKLLMSKVVQLKVVCFGRIYLINEFVLFQYSFLNFSAKNRISWPIMRALAKVWSSVSTVSNVSILSTVSNVIYTLITLKRLLNIL